MKEKAVSKSEKKHKKFCVQIICTLIFVKVFKIKSDIRFPFSKGNGNESFWVSSSLRVHKFGSTEAFLKAGLN